MWICWLCLNQKPQISIWLVPAPRNGKSDCHLLPSTYCKFSLSMSRFCGVMDGFARGTTLAIINFSDGEYSLHLNEMEHPVQMAGSEISTTSSSIDLEQPKVSHEALPHLRALLLYLLAKSFPPLTYLENHLLHALRAAPPTSGRLHLLCLRTLLSDLQPYTST